MVMAQRTYTYSLSVSVEPSGGGRVTPESGTYDSSTEVTLYATPSSGYELDYWSGGASGTDLSVTYSIPPSQTEVVSDEYGNTYEVAWWDEEQDTEVSVTLEAIIYREMEEEPVSTSDPYPILADEIPDDVKLYLEPCSSIQSDDPAILAVAQPLSQGLTTEVDVVNNTLEWCSQNLGWICPQTVENHQSDAVWTLENGGGNCVNFANVMVALFMLLRFEECH